ncbi:hypothetical protein PsorP6_014969 [Peronosclerospora sorghi]|uniref:Uncharacterized protein n=1 Tax=Peronosclerospora sorghi TaxID=230839 RepID=A0ACC0VR71_9STRA|nr:hypothetical protein PsorP6_014969 [Peronosclerospora sorghi]
MRRRKRRRPSSAVRCGVTFLATKEYIHRMFVQYVRGEISSLPWCDTALNAETSTVKQELAAAKSAGFLTINSQPRVNGRVYQKAYVECFVSPKNMKISIDNAAKKPSIQYHGIDASVHSYSNASKSVVAVTWGVLPNK